MIACFLGNISAKYYKHPSMLSRVIAKNVGDVFFETQCIGPTLFLEPNKSAKTLQAKWKKNTIKLWRNAAAVYINLKIKEIKVYTFSIHAELHCILYDKRENLSLQPTESFVLI